MGIIKEFKEFAIKGNIMDLAVAVIIGAAFGKIITSLVDNIIMPIIGSLIGQSFDKLTVMVNGVNVKYGLFIQATVDFIIIAFIAFLIIKSINALKRKDPPQIVVQEPSSTDKLLMEIRDSLKK